MNQEKYFYTLKGNYSEKDAQCLLQTGKHSLLGKLFMKCGFPSKYLEKFFGQLKRIMTTDLWKINWLMKITRK